jgi:putative ABC transport system permease protein
VVLAAAGGAAGLALAQLALTSTATLLADQVPRADEIALDGRVLLFVIAASIVTGIIAGALPALRAGRTDLNDALKEGGRGDGAIGLRTRRALIVCEVALSLVLLMGAGVLVRSLLALRNVDAGFQPENTLTMRVGLPASRYPDGAARRAFFDGATARLRALPGVVAVGTIDNLPFEGGSVQPVVLEGRPELLPREQPTVQVRAITPGYLSAIGIPVVSGRDVADADADVVLVSRSTARLLWGSEDPIGKRVTLPLMSRTQFRQVVGIVGDVKQGEVFEGTSPTVYTYSRERDTGFATFVLRTATPPETLIQPSTAVFRALDPEQPVLDVRTMVEVRDEQLTSQRFTALLLAAFAIGALALAAAGIYSVLAYIVRGRSREIGIRTALGAQTGDVLTLILREGMSPALLGIAVGVVAAFAASSVLERLVFAVSAFDPVTLSGAAIVLAAVALLASVLPAYRAARLDPLTVLRAE